MKSAAILAIGDELLFGESVDTNSAWLAERLHGLGYTIVEHRTVGDVRHAVSAAILAFAPACDVIITTGGLGPTQDDLTRHGLGDALAPGRPLVTDAGALEHLHRWFDGRGVPMPPLNLSQATRPEPARCLRNARGTAPGLAGEIDRCLVFALPGPPYEMQAMFDEFVVPAIGRGTEVSASAVVHAFGLAEAEAAERISDLLDRGRDPAVGITAHEAVITARIRVRGAAGQTSARINELTKTIRDAWSPYAFGEGDCTLAAAAGVLLREHDATLVTAESCTGGWLGKLIVDVPGSSDSYRGGWVTYSNEMKTAALGVPEETLRAHGAVSAEVARSMAEGALTASDARFSLSTTGVAGPAAGQTPVGTVFIGVAERCGRVVESGCRRFAFSGDRRMVRDRTCKAALQMLRFRLLEVDDHTPLLWEVLPSRTEIGA